MNQTSTVQPPWPGAGHQHPVGQSSTMPETAVERERLRQLDIETRLRFAGERRAMDAWLRPEYNKQREEKKACTTHT